MLLRALSIIYICIVGAFVWQAPNASASNPQSLVKFSYQGEFFVGLVDDPAILSHLRSVSPGQLIGKVIFGRLFPISQNGFTNRNWGVRIVEIGDVGPEEDPGVRVCDATPDYVDSHLADFFRAGGIYCPWGASRWEIWRCARPDCGLPIITPTPTATPTAQVTPTATLHVFLPPPVTWVPPPPTTPTATRGLIVCSVC